MAADEPAVHLGDWSGPASPARRLREATLRQLGDGSFAEYYEPFTARPLDGRPQSWTAAVALDLACR